MKDNLDLMERNEMNINSKGGTEITSAQIYDGDIPREVLEQFQIVPSRIRELKSDKIRIYHAHDLAMDPEVQKLKDADMRDKFHHMVFSSEWQYQQYRDYLGIPYVSKHSVIEPGIEPNKLDWEMKDQAQRINLVYTSTPQRGLEILIPVFAELAKKDENIHLHVFSSFKIYGWDDADKNYQGIYDQIQAHPQMTYHGYVPHDELQLHLQGCHIHAYPAVWMETSCRAITEAASAGCMCIHPNFGALPYTGGGMHFTYQGDQDRGKHSAIFYNELALAITRWRDSRDSIIGYLKYVKNYTDQRFNVKKIKFEWSQLFGQLLSEYPDARSRDLPSAMFRYRV